MKKQGVQIEALLDQLEHGSLFDRGLAALAKNRYGTATDLFKEAIEQSQGHLAASWFYQGLSLGYMGNHPQAAEAYEKSIEIDPNDCAAWYNWGVALVDLERHKEAAGKFQQAVAISPDFHEAWSNWGAVLTKLGRYDDAVKKFQTAVTIEPKSLIIWNNWYVCLKKMGREDEAAEVRRKAAEAWGGGGGIAGRGGQLCLPFPVRTDDLLWSQFLS